MGTRGVITFKDLSGGYSVYQHWDCNPEMVEGYILQVFEKRRCWAWPRWEADEFAAAYIATHKDAGGSFRISNGASNHGDLSYAYEVIALPDEGLQLDWKDHYSGEERGCIIPTDAILGRQNADAA